jgi:hypothetical protein
VSVRNTSGLSFSDSGQQILLFQTGQHLVAVAGPEEPAAARIMQLAQALQF